MGHTLHTSLRVRLQDFAYLCFPLQPLAAKVPQRSSLHNTSQLCWPWWGRPQGQMTKQMTYVCHWRLHIQTPGKSEFRVSPDLLPGCILVELETELTKCSFSSCLEPAEIPHDLESQNKDAWSNTTLYCFFLLLKHCLLWSPFSVPEFLNCNWLSMKTNIVTRPDLLLTGNLCWLDFVI